ncbi:MAG: iron-containing alcohol dehydrogenase [Dehalococcoidia bacterium]|nr:iron-containing alcohol dehydrogenase [Dehalococcoidia bacterium]MDD5493344.1 iron-containing alcohol dehydrogenase [Dehalococcoidia bacterium]
MSISRFYIPTRFIIGAGSLAQLGKEVAKLGKVALLATGKGGSMRRTGVLDKVLKDLEEKGVKAITFEKVEPNPRSSTVDEGAKIARENGVQVVIGMGGGSTMDASKCIALASSSTESIWDHYVNKVTSKGRVPPIVLVPTVAASGSEANNGAVITKWETHEKVPVMKPETHPTLSIIDPALTLSLPARTTAQGGVDIFCHLVEAYITAHESTLINDSLRESCMKTVVDTLPLLLNKLDDIEYRSRMTWASTIACSQFANLGGGTGLMSMHGLEHALSGEYDIAHGDGLAALLLAWMKYTLPVREAKFKQLGEKVFGETDGIAATEKWLKKVGMLFTLKDLGIRESDFEKLAANACKTAPWVAFHPTPLDVPAIVSIYKNSC